MGKGGGRSLGLGQENYFVTDGQKRDYVSRDSQCARGATKKQAAIDKSFWKQ